MFHRPEPPWPWTPSDLAASNQAVY
jgi:hypothetical protein